MTRPLAWILLLATVALAGGARAQVRPFVLGGQPVLLERVQTNANAYFRALRPNHATGRWEVDVVVTNGTSETLRTPLILRFDVAAGVAPGVVGAAVDAEGKPFLNLTPLVSGGGFRPGTVLRTFTLSFGDAETRPEPGPALYSLPAERVTPLAVLRTLAEDGIPLEGVEATEIGPSEPRVRTTGRGGWLTLEARTGVLGWRLDRAGHGSAFRPVPSPAAGAVVELPSPRFVRSEPAGPTRFSAATLPAPMPMGWSPLAAGRFPAGAATLELTGPVADGGVVLLVRWDESALVWRRVGDVAAGASRTETVVSTPTLLAAVQADSVPLAPPVPLADGILAGVAFPVDPAALRAVGEVAPVSRSASTNAAQVTAEARVLVTSQSGPLPSGLTLPATISEEYRLRDGTRRVLPAYSAVLVAYQHPGSVTGGLEARFALRPFQLLAGEELAEAMVRVEVLPPASFAGGVLGGNGGSVGSDSLRLLAGPGALEQGEAVLFREVLAADPAPAPPGLELAKAFELSIGEMAAGRRLELELGSQGSDADFVLARAVFDTGRHGFQPVQRFRSDSTGALRSVEPATNGLPGIDGGGQYLLFRTAAGEALVAGIARDATGQPVGGLSVRRGPWTAFTDAGGRFQLLAPPGSAEVSVSDPRTGDSGFGLVEVTTGLDPVEASLDAAPRGPRIASVSPADGAVRVPRVVPVVLTFSRPLNPVTVISGGVQLLEPGGAAIAASVTLSPAGTTVTLLPVNPLKPATGYRVAVAETVADLTARRVEGARESGFTTVDDSVSRGLAAQVTIYEPGATNLTAEILSRIPAYEPQRDHDGIVVEGSPGTAEPAQAVILVNESSGETQTVIADVDGSFVSFIRGTVDDFISAVLVNANGTRNQIPATRQRFDDGSVGLFSAGGTIGSTGPGTPVDLIVDPGSVAGKTRFKLESMTTNSFLELVAGRLPDGAGPVLGAFEMTESGDPLQSAADISAPVKLADLGLPPGSNPTNFDFLVVMPLRVDGRIVHQIVDLAHYEATGPEGGRVRTASPPFVGMLSRKLAQLARSAGMAEVTVPKVASNNDNPHKGETAVFGILPLISRGPLTVGGFVRAVTRSDDGSETSVNLPGATVRVVRLEDEQNPDRSPLTFDGDLVSISDERGNFGFFFRPSEATQTRALLATHPRFPFQRPRTIGFTGERQGVTVVNAELRFLELPPGLAEIADQSPPTVSVGHSPALPKVGTGPDAGATVSVVAVDDKLVGPPALRILSVENLRGEALPTESAELTALPGDSDLPARKVRQFRLTMAEGGRVVLVAAVADGVGQTGQAQHAVSFGVTRPVIPPGEDGANVPLRVTFAWPPPGATNLPSLIPITLRFNRPLAANLFESGRPDGLAFGSGHTLVRVTPTADRRELTIFYNGNTAGPVSLTVGTPMQGEDGSDFDQSVSEPEGESFGLEFFQTAGIYAELEGQSGAGVLLQGRYAYALERRGAAGTFKIYDLEDPREPEELSDVSVGYPTAMALIPNYAMAPEAGEPCETRDLLALFTGHANEPKYLQLGRLAGGRVTFGSRMILSGGATDGSGRPSVAEGVSNAESLSQIVKAKWSPPYLGYLELGADVTSIKLLNLASFQQVASSGGRLDGFPSFAGSDGLDANGDGDFCDAGDVPPSPGRDPLQPPGMAFSTAPLTRAERIEDFDFNAGSGLVVGISRFIGTNLPPRFSTLLAAADTNQLDQAFVSFGATETLRRVLLLPATELETPTNRIVRDVALVTISTGGDGTLAVVDVTVPSAPKLLNRFTVPTGEGSPAGIQVRTDGLLAVATSASVLLVDPSKLALPAGGAVHPGFVGRINGTGNGVRDFVADASGINLTHGGGTRRYVETAPKFSFVHFNALINPKGLAAGDATSVERFLRSATPVRVAEVMQAGSGTNTPALDPARHYYALVDAPGGAADSNGFLPLVLSAVDANGLPQPDRGGTVVPAVVGDEQLYSALVGRRFLDVVFSVANLRRGSALLLDGSGIINKVRAALATASEAKRSIGKLRNLAQSLRVLPEDFSARRLTDNPNHPLYNRYLAGPFVVLGGAPGVDQLSALRQQAADRELDRVYLRPSPRLWVGLPSERKSGYLQAARPFAPDPTKLKSFISELRLNPTLQILGADIPQSGRLIEQLASLSQDIPGSPIGSFFDQGEVITLMVSLLNNAPVVRSVARGDWKPLLLPGAHELIRVNYAERPMVLVPGFAGSKLEVNGANAWVSLALTDEGRQLASLRLNVDGSTGTNRAFATDAIRYTLETPLVDLQPIYGKWLEHLTGELGMTEYEFRKPDRNGAPGGELVQKRLKPGDDALMDQTPVPNLFVFPYDWRLDNQKSAERLRDYVRLALEMNPDADGVDLVGHSNGGLVARAYMLLPGQRPLVKRLITVGTPWLGAPKPLAGLRTGDMNETGINIVAPIPAVRKMLQFSPGAHQLLPSREYFDLGFRPLVEDGFDINTNGIANEAFTFDGYMETLAKHFLRQPLEELEVELDEHPVRRNANGFREGRPLGIGDHRRDASDVEMHHIFGMGAVPDTVGQIRVRGRLVPQPATTNVTLSIARVSSRETEQVRDGADSLISPEDGTLAVNPTNQFRMSEEIEVRYVSGDGTVPIASLARGFGSGRDLNATSAHVYPLVGAFEDELTGHNPMLATETFIGMFDAVYGGRTVEQVRVTAAGGVFTEGSPGAISVSGARSDGRDGPISFVVDFGDGGVELRHGTAGASLAVEHRYRQSGSYLVTVGAATDDKIFGLTSLQVVVANAPPVVSVKGLADGETVSLGETKVLFAEVSDPGLDDRHTFQWSLPGGQARGVTQFAVPVSFDRPGPQTVAVTVHDDEGTGTASLTVNVRPTALAQPAPNFGTDSALASSRLRRSTLPGFVGGHPELIVRINGNASGAFDTTGVSLKQEGLKSEAVALFRNQVLVALFAGAGSAALDVTLDRLGLPLIARFLGQFAQGTEYVRLLRELPDEIAGIDLAATKAVVGARGKDGPLEVDLLYLEGGLPRKLSRWQLSQVSALEGVRLSFDWVNKSGVLERVIPSLLTGDTLDGVPVETVVPRFAVGDEAAAGDRSGPATVGILNPATDRLTILGRDNLTADTNLVLFAVFDSNEDGRLDNDTFYPLDTNVVQFARLPKRPFAIVGVDEQGNVGALDPFRVSETRNFLGAAQPEGELSEYEKTLREIRSTVREVITEARQSPVILGKFLLSPQHLWVFEQGSGANLWKDNFVGRCNGVYIPRKSDNDYELFLPVHLAQPFEFSEADRLRFEAAGPHESGTLTGDWNFKRPVGLDGAGVPTGDDGAIVTWEYTYPPGLAPNGQPTLTVTRQANDDDLPSGFHSPLSPAEVIAREFVRTVTKDPTRRDSLPDTSFFPERREHFMFGRLHLQRPPEFGDDPIGDGGTGRQLLMLKWLLEGAYVTASDGGGRTDFSPNSPSLSEVFANWQRVGVPRAEGLEWGLFQDFAAMKSRPFQVAEVRFGPNAAAQRLRVLQRSIDDAVAQQQASRLKKLGKAAIRATLARLAGDTNLNALVTGTSAELVANSSVRSFEHYILEVSTNSPAARSAFGDFARDRDDLTEPPDLGDFLRAKNGDRDYLGLIVSEPGLYERFVTTTFTFLRDVVQRPTRSPYLDYSQGLRDNGGDAELLQRTDNLNLVVRGRGAGQPGLLELIQDRRIARLDLPLAVEINGPGGAGTVRVTASRSGAPQAGNSSSRIARAETPTAPDGGPLATFEGPADLDEIVDGTETGEAGLTVEGSAFEETAEQAISADSGAGQDSLEVVVNRLDTSVPAPEISDRPIVFVGIRPAGREDFFLLRDWPSDGFRPRAPRHQLRLSDRLEITVFGKPGAGEYSALVTTASDPVARRVRLREFQNTGSYDNSASTEAVRFGNEDNQLDDLLYVKDEELLTVRVSGPGLPDDDVSEVMVDLGEFAVASLEHHDRQLSAKPRFDYEETFLDDPNGLRWASAGVIEFPDDVAKAAFDAGVPDGDNAMRRFLQAFSDPKHPETGEADVLYLHSHGGKDGRLADHVSDSAPGSGQRRPILEPGAHLADLELWNSDAEWLISEACSILNEGFDNQLQPIPGIVAGVERWQQVFRESPRPIHGILGFAYAKTASRTFTKEFLARIRSGGKYVQSWKATWEADGARLPWAMLYYQANARDTQRELGPDPLPGDAMVYESFVTQRAFPGGVPEGNCDGGDCGGTELNLVPFQPGLEVHAPLLTEVSAARIPRELPVIREAVLHPAGKLSQALKRSDGRERLRASDGTGPIGAGKVGDVDSARELAESFLRDQCGVPIGFLRWVETGESIRRVIQKDRISKPQVTGRTVSFDVMVAGLPVSGVDAAVQLDSGGVTRVDIRGAARPMDSVDVERGQPLALAEALALAGPSLLAIASDSCETAVVEARLCWRLVPAKAGKAERAVPSWEINFLDVRNSEVVPGTARAAWLDAFTGELLEVSE